MEASHLLDEMTPPKKPTNAPSATNMDDLKDDILPIIVSFLPAHEAVRTSMLAKRWRHVWTLAPTLRITAVGGFGSAKYNIFVDRLLFLRSEGPCRLESCEFDIVQSEFDFDWSLSAHRVYHQSLQSALDRNVHTLRCRFDIMDIPYDLPEPAAPLLSQHLKRLGLHQIRVALDFSGCPALMDLKMTECIILDNNMVSPSLKHLSMRSCELHIGHRTSISLPSLVHLELVDCLGRLPLLESLPSLVKATVNLGVYPGDLCATSESGCLNDNPCCDCLFSFEFDADRGNSYFFKGLSQATHLELSACSSTAFIFQRDLKWRPTFPMLTTLVMDDWCLDADLNAVILFIQQSPNLEKLTLVLFEDFDSSMVIEGSNEPLAWTSHADHLEMIEIKCKKVDDRINMSDARIDRILKILSAGGISLEKVVIKKTATSSGSECSDSDFASTGSSFK